MPHADGVAVGVVVFFDHVEVVVDHEDWAFWARWQDQCAIAVIGELCAACCCDAKALPVTCLARKDPTSEGEIKPVWKRDFYSPRLPLAPALGFEQLGGGGQCIRRIIAPDVSMTCAVEILGMALVGRRHELGMAHRPSEATAHFGGLGMARLNDLKRCE